MIGTLIGKLIIKIEKLFKKDASTFPGSFVLKLSPNYLKKLKYPDKIILVTGSAGKGSTTSLISSVLEKSGMKVCTNKEGANLLEGITTAIIKSTKFKTVKADALVLETDERSLKNVTKFIKPTYVIINNITRDQPPRQGTFDIVFNEIFKGLNKSVHLIVNGDDPILRKYSLIHKGEITYFGMEKTEKSFEKMDDVKDYLYCPKCKHKLKFEYYHYGSVGNYKCTNCDFKREKIKYNITNVDIDKKILTINDTYKLDFDKFVLFNLYNIAGSFALCDILKIDSNLIVDTINEANIKTKLFDEFTVNKRNYTVLNCKAENNATYNLSLIYSALNNDKKTIVLGLRQISRRYNHFDLSWLYDIYFEIYKDNNVDKIVCTGPYAYDFACRIKYAGIPEDKIITLDNLDNIKETIEKETKGNVYAVLNFDYVEPFINNIKGEEIK